MDNMDDGDSAEPVLMAMDMIMDEVQPTQPEDECYCGSEWCKNVRLSVELDSLLNPKVGGVSHIIYFVTANSSGLTSDQYLSRHDEYQVDRQCCFAWAPNYVAYRCRTCSKALTMALCADCFRAGDHQGHDYNMFKSRSGGACDCGHSIMASSGHCLRHGKNAKAIRQGEPIPPELTCSASRSMPRLIHRLAIQLRRSHVDLAGEVDAYLDELVRLSNRSAVLRSLMVDALISEKAYSSQLRLLQSHPDKEVANVVKEGLKKLKRERKGLMPFKLPEWAKDTKLPQMINAFCDSQQSSCATFVEELIFWVIVFEFPQKLVCFLLGFLVDERYKMIFSRAFVNSYPRIILTLTCGNRSEPRRHFRDSYEQLSRRILQVSVQIYNEKELIEQLCRGEHALHVIIYCLRVAVEGYGSPIDGIRGCLKVNPLRRDDWPESTPPKVVNCDTMIIRDRHLASFTDDLSAILEQENVSLQLVGSPELLDIWLKMVSYFQTMSPYKRELNEHTPYDTGPHVSVFLIENDFCMAPMWQLLAHLRSRETRAYTDNLTNSLHKALAIWFHKMSMRPDSLLDRYHMSFHIPLHRMLAATLRQMIYQQERRDLEDIFARLTKNQSSYGELYGHKATSGSQIKTSISDFMKMLLLHPLQALTFYHETRSAMWTRNGLMTINQALTYVSNSFCKSTIDLDMFLLRYCASKLNPNYLLHVLLSRFHAWQWLSFKSNHVMGSNEITAADIQRFYNFNIMPEQVLQMVESALVTLIQLLTLSIHCNTSEREQTKQEMIALISVADRPYSHLEMSMVEQNGLDSERLEFDYLLEELTIFKRAQHGHNGSNLQQGCYTLKPEVWNNDYNPIQVQYRFYQKREYQLSLERFFQHSRLTGKLDKRFHSSVLWPPLKLPTAESAYPSMGGDDDDEQGARREDDCAKIGQFGRLDLSPLLKCQSLLGLVYCILFKSVYVSEIPDTIMAYTIHLLELSLRKAIENSSSTSCGGDKRGKKNSTKVSSAFEGKFHYANLRGTSVEEIGALKLEAQTSTPNYGLGGSSHSAATAASQMPVDRNLVGHPIYCQERKVELTATPASPTQSDSSDLDDNLFPVVGQALDLAFDGTWFPFQSPLDNCLVHIVDVHSLPRKEFDLILRPTASKAEFLKRRAGGGSRMPPGATASSRGGPPRSSNQVGSCDDMDASSEVLAAGSDAMEPEDRSLVAHPNLEEEEDNEDDRWAAMIDSDLEDSDEDEDVDEDDNDDDDDDDDDDDEEEDDDDDDEDDDEGDEGDEDLDDDLGVSRRLAAVRQQQRQQPTRPQHDNVVGEVILVDPNARTIHRLRNREPSMRVLESIPDEGEVPVPRQHVVPRRFSPMATGNNNNPVANTATTSVADHTYSAPDADLNRMEVESLPESQSAALSLVPASSLGVNPNAPRAAVAAAASEQLYPENLVTEPRRAILAVEPRPMIEGSVPPLALEGSADQMSGGQMPRAAGGRWTSQLVDRAAAQQQRDVEGQAGDANSNQVSRGEQQQRQQPTSGGERSLSEVDIQTRFMGFFSSGISGNQAAGSSRIGASMPPRLRTRQTARRYGWTGANAAATGGASATGQEVGGGPPRVHMVNQPEVYTTAAATAAVTQAAAAMAYYRPDHSRIFGGRTGADTAQPAAASSGPSGARANSAPRSPAAAAAWFAPRHYQSGASAGSASGAIGSGPRLKITNKRLFGRGLHQHQQHRDQRQRTRMRKDQMRHSESLLTLLLRLHAKYSQRANSYQFDLERAKTNVNPKTRTRIGDGVHFVTIALDLICASDVDRMCAKLARLQSLIWPQSVLAASTSGASSLAASAAAATATTSSSSSIESEAMEAEGQGDQQKRQTAASVKKERDVRLPVSQTSGETKPATGDVTKSASSSSAASTLKGADAAERRRRAREYQSKLMAEFASKQRAFIANYEPSAKAHGSGSAATSVSLGVAPAGSSLSPSRAGAAGTTVAAIGISPATATTGGDSTSGANLEQPINLSAKSTTAAAAPVASTSSSTGAGQQIESPPATRVAAPASRRMIDDWQGGDKQSPSQRPSTSREAEHSTTKRQQSSSSTPTAAAGAATSDKAPRVHESANRDSRKVANQPPPPPECCICGLEASGDSKGANPLGQVVLLQSSSVWGHAHLRPARHRRLPAEDYRLPELKVQTYAKYLERRIDLLSENFPEASWLDAVNIGAEGGVHVQSCGHQLHVECHQSYLRSLDQEDRLRGRNDSDEFLCPVCRQLANSVLPILEPNSDEENNQDDEAYLSNVRASIEQSPSSDPLAARGGEGSSSARQDSNNDDDELGKMYAQVARRLASRKQPDQRHLQSSAAFCDHVTKATSPQFRCVRAEASMHSLFLFLASIARSNLETEVLVRSTRAAQGAAKRSCLKLLLHVLALNAQTLIDANWFTCPQIWSHLTHRVEANDRLGVKPANSEVPLLLRDPTAMLLQFLFAITSSQLSKRRHFLALTRALFNLTVVQSIALALSYLMPEFELAVLESDHSFAGNHELGTGGDHNHDHDEARQSDEHQLMSLDGIVAAETEPPLESATSNLQRSQFDGGGGGGAAADTTATEAPIDPEIPLAAEGKRRGGGGGGGGGGGTNNSTGADDQVAGCRFKHLLRLVAKSLVPLLAKPPSWATLPLKNFQARFCWEYLEALKPLNDHDTQADRVETFVQLACLPYLRAAALLQHHLYGVEYPKLELPMDESPASASQVASDFWSLTAALKLLDVESTAGNASLVGAALRWPRATSGANMARSWTDELLRFGGEFPIAAGSLLICRSLMWHRPALMPLPHSFDEIFSHYYRRKCNLCNQVPKDVAVCLVCGTPICFRVSCCKDRSRSRQIHSQHCGANTAVLLAVHTSSVVVIRGARACVWGSVYLDAHDEEDNGLQRGKPLYLVKERYELLEDQWLTHSFDHHCSRRWIYLQDNQ